MNTVLNAHPINAVNTLPTEESNDMPQDWADAESDQAACASACQVPWEVTLWRPSSFPWGTVL